MKKQILISLFLLAFFCATPVFAQKTDVKSKETKPDFTGTWIWKMGDNDKWFHQMTIVQEETEIRISDKISFPNQSLIETESKHFTDGRGEKNQLADGKLSESVTNWKGSKLIFTFYQTDSGNGKKKTLGTVEFSLKKDKLIFKKKSADNNRMAADIILSENEREFVRVK